MGPRARPASNALGFLVISDGTGPLTGIMIIVYAPPRVDGLIGYTWLYLVTMYNVRSLAVSLSILFAVAAWPLDLHNST